MTLWSPRGQIPTQSTNLKRSSSNLEYFARYAAENLAKDVLVVSCLAAIPATKIKSSLNVNFVIQTTVAIERLPLSHRGVGAALYHIAHNKDDANESLRVISNMFQKMHMGDCVIPKSIDSAADFMSIIVSRLFGDLKSLFFHLDVNSRQTKSC